MQNIIDGKLGVPERRFRGPFITLQVLSEAGIPAINCRQHDIDIRQTATSGGLLTMLN